MPENPYLKLEKHRKERLTEFAKTLVQQVPEFQGGTEDFAIANISNILNLPEERRNNAYSVLAEKYPSVFGQTPEQVRTKLKLLWNPIPDDVEEKPEYFQFFGSFAPSFKDLSGEVTTDVERLSGQTSSLSKWKNEYKNSSTKYDEIQNFAKKWAELDPNFKGATPEFVVSNLSMQLGLPEHRKQNFLAYLAEESPIYKGKQPLDIERDLRNKLGLPALPDENTQAMARQLGVFSPLGQFGKLTEDTEVKSTTPSDVAPMLRQIITKAESYVGLQEAGNNLGPQIKKFQDYTGAVGEPWCASFVTCTVNEALEDVGAKPVLPKIASSQGLYNWGAKKGYITNTPKPGDVVVWRLGGSDKGHTGIVTSVDHATQTFTTIEGNTSETGSNSREGTGVFRKRHSFADVGVQKNKLWLRGFIDMHKANGYSGDVADYIADNEGSYTSINPNDAGGVSLGKLQWHGANAQYVMKKMREANPTEFDSIMGQEFLPLLGQEVDWQGLQFSPDLVQRFQKLAELPAMQKVQDKIASRFASNYMVIAEQEGIIDPAAQTYYADLVNQFGQTGAKQFLVKGKTLDAIYEASRDKYPERRKKLYDRLQKNLTPDDSRLRAELQHSFSKSTPKRRPMFGGESLWDYAGDMNKQGAPEATPPTEMEKVEYENFNIPRVKSSDEARKLYDELQTRKVVPEDKPMEVGKTAADAAEDYDIEARVLQNTMQRVAGVAPKDFERVFANEYARQKATLILADRLERFGAEALEKEKRVIMSTPGKDWGQGDFRVSQLEATGQEMRRVQEASKRIRVIQEKFDQHPDVLAEVLLRTNPKNDAMQRRLKYLDSEMDKINADFTEYFDFVDGKFTPKASLVTELESLGKTITDLKNRYEANPSYDLQDQFNTAVTTYNTKLEALRAVEKNAKAMLDKYNTLNKEKQGILEGSTTAYKESLDELTSWEAFEKRLPEIDRVMQEVLREKKKDTDRTIASISGKNKQIDQILKQYADVDMLVKANPTVPILNLAHEGLVGLAGQVAESMGIDEAGRIVDYTALQLAKKINDETANAIRQGMSATEAAQAAFSKHFGKELLPFVGDIFALRDALSRTNVVNKYLKGEKLSEAEKALIEALEKNISVQQKVEIEGGPGTKNAIADIGVAGMLQLIKYVPEFLLTQGVFSSAKSGMKKGVLNVLQAADKALVGKTGKGLLRKIPGETFALADDSLLKGTSKLLEPVAATIQGVVAQPLSTIADVVTRQTPYTIDNEGKLVEDFQNKAPFLHNLGVAVGTKGLEFYTERLGEAVVSGVAKTPGTLLDIIVPDEKVMALAADPTVLNPWRVKLNDFLARSKWGDVREYLRTSGIYTNAFAENSEEILNQIGQNILEGKDPVEGIDAPFVIGTAIALAPFSAVGMVGGINAAVGKQRNMRNAILRAKRSELSAFENGWQAYNGFMGFEETAEALQKQNFIELNFSVGGEKLTPMQFESLVTTGSYTKNGQEVTPELSEVEQSALSEWKAADDVLKSVQFTEVDGEKVAVLGERQVVIPPMPVKEVDAGALGMGMAGSISVPDTQAILSGMSKEYADNLQAKFDAEKSRRVELINEQVNTTYESIYGRDDTTVDERVKILMSPESTVTFQEGSELEFDALKNWASQTRFTPAQFKQVAETGVYESNGQRIVPLLSAEEQAVVDEYNNYTHGFPIEERAFTPPSNLFTLAVEPGKEFETEVGGVKFVGVPVQEIDPETTKQLAQASAQLYVNRQAEKGNIKIKLDGSNLQEVNDTLKGMGVPEIEAKLLTQIADDAVAFLRTLQKETKLPKSIFDAIQLRLGLAENGLFRGGEIYVDPMALNVAGRQGKELRAMTHELGHKFFETLFPEAMHLISKSVEQNPELIKKVLGSKLGDYLLQNYEGVRATKSGDKFYITSRRGAPLTGQTFETEAEALEAAKQFQANYEGAYKPSILGREFVAELFADVMQNEIGPRSRSNTIARGLRPLLGNFADVLGQYVYVASKLAGKFSFQNKKQAAYRAFTQAAINHAAEGKTTLEGLDVKGVTPNISALEQEVVGTPTQATQSPQAAAQPTQPAQPTQQAPTAPLAQDNAFFKEKVGKGDVLVMKDGSTQRVAKVVESKKGWLAFPENGNNYDPAEVVFIRKMRKARKVQLGDAIWRTKDSDIPIVITGESGTYNGVTYVSVQGSTTAVPLTEVYYQKVATQKEQAAEAQKMIADMIQTGKISALEARALTLAQMRKALGEKAEKVETYVREHTSEQSLHKYSGKTVSDNFARMLVLSPTITERDPSVNKALLALGYGWDETQSMDLDVVTEALKYGKRLPEKPDLKSVRWTPEEQAIIDAIEAVEPVRENGVLLAPNGQPSNLSDWQWRVVRTPQFKAWFGDWENDPENSSKVVDENGEPLVVYHGTAAGADFSTFVSQTGDIGFHAGGLEQTAHFYAAPLLPWVVSFRYNAPGRIIDYSYNVDYYSERAVAEAFAKEITEQGVVFGNERIPVTDVEVTAREVRLNDSGRIYPVFLNIRNPLTTLSDTGSFSVDKPEFVAAVRRILPELTLDLGGGEVNQKREYLQKAFKDLGFDGVYYLNRREGQFILNPSVLQNLQSNAQTSADLDYRVQKTFLEALNSEQVSDAAFLEKYPSATFSWIAFDANQLKSAIFSLFTEDASILKSARDFIIGHTLRPAIRLSDEIFTTTREYDAFMNNHGALYEELEYKGRVDEIVDTGFLVEFNGVSHYYSTEEMKSLPLWVSGREASEEETEDFVRDFLGEKKLVVDTVAEPGVYGRLTDSEFSGDREYVEETLKSVRDKAKKFGITSNTDVLFFENNEDKLKNIKNKDDFDRVVEQEWEDLKTRARLPKTSFSDWAKNAFFQTVFNWERLEKLYKAGALVQFPRMEALIEEGIQSEEKREELLGNIKSERQKQQARLFDAWINYLDGNNTYSPSFRNELFRQVMQFVVELKNGEWKKSKRTSDDEKDPMAVTPVAVAEVYNAALAGEGNLVVNYAKALLDFTDRQARVEDNSITQTSTEGIWIRYKSRANDPKNFNETVAALSAMAMKTEATPCKGWCTRSAAAVQLEGGDFFVFATETPEGLFPRIAVRMAGDALGELRGIEAGQALEESMLPEARKFLTENNIGDVDLFLEDVKLKQTLRRLEETLRDNPEYELTREDKIALNIPFVEGTVWYGDFVNYDPANHTVTSEVDYDATDLLENKPHLRKKLRTTNAPSIEEYMTYTDEVKTSLLDRNYRIHGLTRIVGNFVYDHARGAAATLQARSGAFDGRGLRIISGFTSLGSVENITGNVDVSVGLEDFGELQEIGGFLSLPERPTIESLGKLRKVGGGLFMLGTYLPSLGNLTFIGGGLYAEGSYLSDLGYLAHVGGDLDLVGTLVETLRYLKYVGGNVHLQHSAVNDLGFLKKVGGNLLLPGTYITSLGNLEEVGGDLSLVETHPARIKSLGKLRRVGGNVTFGALAESTLMTLRYIGGNAYFPRRQTSNALDDLGALEEIGGDAHFERSNIKYLGNLRRIGGSLVRSDGGFKLTLPPFTRLWNLEVIGGDAELEGITDIGKLREVGGDIIGVSKAEESELVSKIQANQESHALASRRDPVSETISNPGVYTQITNYPVQTPEIPLYSVRDKAKKFGITNPSDVLFFELNESKLKDVRNKEEFDVMVDREWEALKQRALPESENTFYQSVFKWERIVKAYREGHYVQYPQMEELIREGIASEEKREDILGKLKVERHRLQTNIINRWLAYLEGNTTYAPSFRNELFRQVMTYVPLLNEDGWSKTKRGKDDERDPLTVSPYVVGELYALFSVTPELYSDLAVSYAELLQTEAETAARMAAKESTYKQTSENGIWIKYPSRQNDPGNYDVNVANLAAMAQKTRTTPSKGWCTASAAASQLAGGDFYIYATESNTGLFPRIAVRMEGNRLGEIRGIEVGQALEPEMLDEAQNFLVSNNIADAKRFLTDIERKKALRALNIKFENDPNAEFTTEDAKVVGLPYVEGDVWYGDLDYNLLLVKQLSVSGVDYKSVPFTSAYPELSTSATSYLDALYGKYTPTVKGKRVVTGITKVVGNARVWYSTKAIFVYEGEPVAELGSIQEVTGRAAVYWAEGDALKLKANSVDIRSDGVDINITPDIQAKTITVQAVHGAVQARQKVTVSLHDSVEKVSISGGTVRLLAASPTASVELRGSRVTEVATKKLQDLLVRHGSMPVGLGNLETVENLVLNNTDIQTIGELRNAGNVSLVGNSDLESLGNLEVVAGVLNIKEAPKLRSLGNLKYAKSLNIADSYAIEDFGSLRKVENVLSIHVGLLSSLHQLQSVGTLKVAVSSAWEKFIAENNSELVVDLGNMVITSFGRMVSPKMSDIVFGEHKGQPKPMSGVRISRDGKATLFDTPLDTGFEGNTHPVWKAIVTQYSNKHGIELKSKRWSPRIYNAEDLKELYIQNTPEARKNFLLAVNAQPYLLGAMGLTKEEVYARYSVPENLQNSLAVQDQINDDVTTPWVGISNLALLSEPMTIDDVATFVREIKVEGPPLTGEESRLYGTALSQAFLAFDTNVDYEELSVILTDDISSFTGSEEDNSRIIGLYGDIRDEIVINRRYTNYSDVISALSHELSHRLEAQLRFDLEAARLSGKNPSPLYEVYENSKFDFVTALPLHPEFLAKLDEKYPEDSERREDFLDYAYDREERFARVGEEFVRWALGKVGINLPISGTQYNEITESDILRFASLLKQRSVIAEGLRSTRTYSNEEMFYIREELNDVLPTSKDPIIQKYGDDLKTRSKWSQRDAFTALTTIRRIKRENISNDELGERIIRQRQEARLAQRKQTEEDAIARIEKTAEYWEHGVIDAHGFVVIAKPMEVNPKLKPHQKDAVSLAVESLEKNGSFLLVHGTGTGKTYTTLEVAKKDFERTGGITIILTDSVEIIEKNFLPAADDLGINLLPASSKVKDPGIYITTYSKLQNFVGQKSTLLIFDEAQALINRTSQRSILADAMMDNTDAVLISTATLADKPEHYWYVGKALNSPTFFADLKLTPSGYLPVDLSPQNAAAVSRAYFYKLATEGKLSEVVIDTERVKFTDYIFELSQEQIEEYLKKLAGRRQNAIPIVRYAEEYKHKLAIQMAKDHIKAGGQSLVYVESVNDIDVDGTLEQGTVNALRKLAPSFAVITGNTPVKERMRLKDEFQAGKIKGIITTRQTSGVGLDFDDVKGDKPRKIIMLSAPFSAISLMQVIGRVNRLNTKSNSEVVMLLTQQHHDEWRNSILLAKLEELQEASRAARQLMESRNRITTEGGQGVDGGLKSKRYYSNLYDSLTKDKYAPHELKSILAKSPFSFAIEKEMEWLGFDSFLDGKKSVTKQEIQEFINSKQIDVEYTDSGLLVGGVPVQYSEVGDTLVVEKVTMDALNPGNLADVAKRILLYAAENNFRKIAWVPGSERLKADGLVATRNMTWEVEGDVVRVTMDDTPEFIQRYQGVIPLADAVKIFPARITQSGQGELTFGSLPVYNFYNKTLPEIFGQPTATDIQGRTLPVVTLPASTLETAVNVGYPLYSKKHLVRQMQDIQEVRDSRGNLLAPNGKVSNLNDWQWKAVRTQVFKKWFGDWEQGQGVLDENGEPRVVFHGTAAEFNTFVFEKKPAKSDWLFTDGMYIARDVKATISRDLRERGWLLDFKGEEIFATVEEAKAALEAKKDNIIITKRPAFFFANDPMLAEEYARNNNGHVIRAFVRINKIFDYRTEEARSIVNAYITSNFDRILPIIRKDAVLSLLPPTAYDIFNEYKRGGWAVLEAFPELIAKIKAMGYDGYTTKQSRNGVSSLSYAVFDGRQVKSAVSSEFGQSPNIFYSKRDVFRQIHDYLVSGADPRNLFKTLREDYDDISDDKKADVIGEVKQALAAQGFSTLSDLQRAISGGYVYGDLKQYEPEENEFFVNAEALVNPTEVLTQLSGMIIPRIYDQFHELKRLQEDALLNTYALQYYKKPLDELTKAERKEVKEVVRGEKMLPDKFDAYIGETVAKGMTAEAIRILHNTELHDFMVARDEARKHGVTQEELDEYLYAWYAPVRNWNVAQASPGQFRGPSLGTFVSKEYFPEPREMFAVGEPGSGMSNDRAIEILSRYFDDVRVEANEYGELKNVIVGKAKSDKTAIIESLAAMVYATLEKNRVASVDGEVLGEGPGAITINGGFDTQEFMDMLRAENPRYVPLRGFEIYKFLSQNEAELAEQTETENLDRIADYINKLYNRGGKAGLSDKGGGPRAAGRVSFAASPTAYAFAMRQNTIGRLIRNQEIGVPLLNFVNSITDTKTVQQLAQLEEQFSMGMIDEEEYQSILKSIEKSSLWLPANKRKLVRHFNEKSGMWELVPDSFSGDVGTTFFVKKDGELYRLNIKHKALARALNSTDVVRVPAVIRWWRGYYSLLRNLYTSWNIDFPLANMQRDLGVAMMHRFGESRGGAIKQAMQTLAMFKQVWPAMRGVYLTLKGDKTGKYSSNPWVREFREARANGIMTGYISSVGAEDYMKKLNQEMGIARSFVARQLLKYAAKGYKDSVARRTAFGLAKNIVRAGESISKTGENLAFAVNTLRGLGGIMETIGIMSEMSTRLVYYRHMKNNGLTSRQAAGKAKELTVNFDRQGTWGPLLKTWWLFINPSLQSVKRIAEALKRKRTRKLWGGMAALSLLQNYLTLLLLGKDDDGEWVYNKIPEWQRHNSIIIPIVRDGLPDWVKTTFGLKNIETGNSKFLAFTWRVPYVYNIIHVTGVSIIEALTKNNPEGLKSAAMNVAATLATTSFTGLNPLGSETINLSSFAPTLVKPAVEVALNEGFYGKIHPEVFPTDKRPPSVVMTQSVRDEARMFAEFVNELTGGTEAKAGWASLYPDDIQYLEDQVLGGLGKTLLNMAQTVNNLSSGRKVEFHRIPLLRTMFMLERPTFTSQRYYEIKQELEDLKGEYTLTANLAVAEASDAAKERWIALQQEKETGRLTLLPIFQEYEKALNEAYDELRAARKLEDYDRVDEIQEYILERQIEFIGRYNTLTEKR